MTPETSAAITERRPHTHEHFGRERIDMVDSWVKQLVCYCGYTAELQPSGSDVRPEATNDNGGA